jgi:integrase
MEATKTPGVYRRGGRYVVVWQHRGKQRKSFHRTYAEAREAKGQRQAGDRQATTRITFEQYAREWIASYQGRTSRGFSEGTREAYRKALDDHAVPFFEGYRLRDVTAPDVRRFVTSLADGDLSPGTVRKYVAPLRAMYATAVEDGLLQVDPTAKIRVNGRAGDADEEQVAKAMTLAELGRILSALPESWRLFFELLAHSGLRISEALGLDWSDVEFGKQPRLLIRRQHYRGTTKRLKTSNGRRDLPLSPSMARRLWAVRPAGAEGPVFATGNGTRYGDRNVTRILEGVRDDAGLDWVSCHSFRHTCASLLIENGKTIRQVSEWLGHSDPAFTLRTYVHLMDSGLGEADFFDDAVGKAWATEDPETAANEEAESLESGEDHEQPQPAVRLAASS